MQFSPEKSVLLIIDVQGNLAYKMHEKDKLFHNLTGLIKAAQILEIPVVYTEEAPEKIGKTVPEMAHLLGGVPHFSKDTFSCCGEPAFFTHLKSFKRKQVIVAGIETHVCVFQTALDLVKNKYDVQVVGDAVSSRMEQNKEIALARLRQESVTITCVEMLVMELLRTSQHEKFRDVLRLIK
jgi:nicotinamidase-related amidase